MKIQEIIEKATAVSRTQGWNETEDVKRTAMLIVTEISEAVQAHRKGKFADAVSYIETDCSPVEFEKHIKDTVEDELADIIIRICSFLGQKNYVTIEGTTDYTLEYAHSLENQPFADIAFDITKAITNAFDKEIDYDALIRTIQSVVVWAVVCIIKPLALYKGCDLEWHILEKIRYNESRNYQAEY